jgi:hypothetical protein
VSRRIDFLTLIFLETFPIANHQMMTITWISSITLTCCWKLDAVNYVPWNLISILHTVRVEAFVLINNWNNSYEKGCYSTIRNVNSASFFRTIGRKTVDSNLGEVSRKMLFFLNVPIRDMWRKKAMMKRTVKE